MDTPDMPTKVRSGGACPPEDTPVLLGSGVDPSYLEQQEGRGHGVEQVQVFCSAGAAQREPVIREDELQRTL